MATHKHQFQVINALEFRGKMWTHLRCRHCPAYYMLERGWFQHSMTYNWSRLPQEKR